MGVGMPTALLLEQFGEHIRSAFGKPAYLVGSAMEDKKPFRDVDIRLILSDEEYKQQGYGDPNYPFKNRKWVAMTLAFSALGRQITGLPIDFQIQEQTYANAKFDKPRSALGISIDTGREINP